MVELGFDLLLSLPTVLSCEILSSWLNVPNLTKLDSAYCNQEKRQQLHALYEQPLLVCSTETCPGQLIEWLMKRRIRLSNIGVCAELDANITFLYFKEFGSFILSVSISKGVSANTVRAIARSGSNVRSLAIKQGDGTVFELLSSFQSLQKLNLHVSNWTESTTHNSPNLPNLRKLEIGWPHLADADIAAFVEKCPNLTHFAPRGIFDDAIPVIAKLTNLIALNLSELDDIIDDAALMVIVQNCLSIVHSDLQNCSQITDVGVYTVATTLKLKSIALPGDYEVTDLSLEHLACCASTLQTLHIAQTVAYHDSPCKITYSSIETLLRKTSNCKYTWSSNIFDHVRQLRACAHATHIIVDTNVTDLLLHDIAKTCKSVTYLDIEVDTDTDAVITSKGLFNVIRNCPMLQTICVNRKFDKTRYADVLAAHAKLFTKVEESAYDVMEMSKFHHVEADHFIRDGS